MRRINLGEQAFGYDEGDPDGFRSGMARFGPQLGARQTGASLYELAPGEALCPYHYEYGEEEWALVVDGSPSVRTPEGTEQLAPLDLVFFPKGPEGAHQIRNDSDKIGIWNGGDRGDDVIVQRSSNVDYWHGEA